METRNPFNWNGEMPFPGDEWPDLFYLESEDIFHVALREPPGGGRPRLPEALVQDIWERQNFNRADLQTVTGESVTVLNPGTRNTDGGPDFSSALLRIGDVDWIGDVEVHVASGHWNDHRHIENRLYNSVILHVALHADVWTGNLQREDGSVLPEVILFPRLLEPIRRLIHDFHKRSDEPILCAGQWNHVPESLILNWLGDLASARMRDRAQRVRLDSELGFDADQYLYERIFAALGYAKNSAAMRDLARRLPLRFILNEINDDDIEACFFGVAGLIPHPQDLLDADRETADHAMALRQRFERLRFTHNLEEWPRERWKYFRLRPSNFPPLRIAQGLTLLQRGGLLRQQPVSRLRAAALSVHPLRNLRRAFYTELPDFWTRHVRLERATSMTNTEIGRQRIDVILINAVLPTLSRMAIVQDDVRLRNAIHQVLCSMPPETDEVVRRFKKLGTNPQTAAQAQGMHELYSRYCVHARCLSCRIGHHLLGKDQDE